MEPRRLLADAARILRARIELSGLLVLGLAAAALWVFAAVADEVTEGETRDFDHAVIVSLRSADEPSDPWGPLWLEEVARDVTALGGVAVLLLLTAGSATFLSLQGQKRASLYIVAVVVAGMLVSTLLKQLFDRPRPDLVPHLAQVYTSSFPSGHSMMSTLTYLSLAGVIARHQRRRRVKVFVVAAAALVALLVGTTRVYLGVHYPTDVLAGWTAGAAWALACVVLARSLARRGEIEPEEPEVPEEPEEPAPPSRERRRVPERAQQ